MTLTDTVKRTLRVNDDGYIEMELIDGYFIDLTSNEAVALASALLTLANSGRVRAERPYIAVS